MPATGTTATASRPPASTTSVLNIRAGSTPSAAAASSPNGPPGAVSGRTRAACTLPGPGQCGDGRRRSSQREAVSRRGGAPRARVTAVVKRDRAPLSAAPVLDLDLAAGEGLADDHDGRYAQQVGVGERDSGAGAAVVEQHPQAGPLERLRQAARPLPAAPPCRSRRCARPPGPPPRGQIRPRSSWFCSMMAATARLTPMPYEPMVTRDRRAVRAEHVELESVRVLAAELEDVADLDGPADDQLVAAAGARIAFGDRRDVEIALDGEVATGRHVERRDGPACSRP